MTLAEEIAVKDCAMGVHRQPCQCRGHTARCGRCFNYREVWRVEEGVLPPYGAVCRPCYNADLTRRMADHARRVEDGRTHTAL